MNLSLEQMAESHLQSVEKAIIDLENQAKNINDEINKLKDYLKRGRETIRASQSAF